MSSYNVIKDQGHSFPSALSLLEKSLLQSAQADDKEIVKHTNSEEHEAKLAEIEQLLTNAREQADQILAEAEQKAEVMMKQATDDGYQSGYDIGKKDGFHAGHESGFNEGYQKGIKEAKTYVKSALGMVEEAKRKIKEDWANHEEEMIRFVCFLVQSIVQKEVDAYHEDIVREVVKKASQKISEKRKAVIRVNPSDFRALELDQIQFGFQEVEYIADERVAIGGCLIETNNGTVDAQIHTQLEKMITQINETLKEKVLG